MNSTANKLLEQVEFYLDESIYSRVLLEAMEAAGAIVHHVSEPEFPKGITDEQWLTQAGERGWICLLRDQRVQRRWLERRALAEASVAAFVFTGGQVTAKATANVIVPLLPKFAQMSISEPKPFLYTFGLAGRLNKQKIRKR